MAAQSILTVGDLTVEVTRKPIRRMYLRLAAKTPALSAQAWEHTVRLSAPMQANDAQIIVFVQTQRPWIARQISAVAAADIPVLQWTEHQRRVAKERLLEVTAPMFDAWISALGVPVPEVRTRRMTTRWGSCNPSARRIWLSLELARFRQPLIEYVVVHELAHLRVAGHGPAFRSILDEALPDWQQRRWALNHATHEMLDARSGLEA